MKTIISFLLFFLSFSAWAEQVLHPATQAQIDCMLPVYDRSIPQYHYKDGQKIPLDLWFEQHPEQAEKYYRENAEMRKRTMKNIEAGRCR